MNYKDTTNNLNNQADYNKSTLDYNKSTSAKMKERQSFQNLVNKFKPEISRVGFTSDEFCHYDVSFKSASTETGVIVSCMAEIKVRNLSIATYEDVMMEVEKYNNIWNRREQTEMIYPKFKHRIRLFYIIFYIDGCIIFNIDEIDFENVDKINKLCPATTCGYNEMVLKPCYMILTSLGEVIKY